jgi:hypothetical protein
MGLIADLRAAGETNAVAARDRRIPPRAMFPKAFAAMPLEITAPILVMTGWAPHESQPRPARPGSATRSLAAALGSVEHKAGEKPAPRDPAPEEAG